MQFVLAVDGGNTKTIALVAALDGTILGYGRAGCGDIYHTGSDGKGSPDIAFSNIEAAVGQTLQAAGVERTDLISGVFNMAGADWPEDFALLQSAFTERGFGRVIHVQNDALGVLHAASRENVGVSVVCGTGAATGARGADGRVWHSSFWQIGAEGSHDLGRKALWAVVRAEMGLVEPTSLKKHVLAFYGFSTVEEVLHYLTCRDQRGYRPRYIDGLTPMLLDEATAGDRVALDIVQEHGRSLGHIATVAARKVGIEGTAFPLVLAGGVLRHPTSVLADAIIDCVRITSPEVQPTRSRFEPVIGVLFSALESAGIELTDTIMARLVPTIPGASLFDTVNGTQ